MISIIIPVFNEPGGLKHTLDSLIQQNFSADAYEIIVVDNGSSDHTYVEAEKYQKQFPQLVRLAKEDHLKGSYAARNKGLEIAKGETICFIDADMSIAPGFLTQVVHFFKEKQPDYFGCRVEVYSDKNTLAAKYNQIHGFAVEGDLKHNHYVPTCCLCVKRSVFDKVGLFDYRLESGGDYEFGQRVYKADLQQMYADHIIMKHPARWRYTSLVNKSKRVARGIAQLYAYYPEVYKKNYNKYFSKKRHLPRNPFNIYRKGKQRGISLNFFEAIILSFYHIPITFHSSAEAKRAYFSIKKEMDSVNKYVVK